MFVLACPSPRKSLRPIVVYVFLIVGLRLAGKRELAQLNPFDLVVLLTISNTVQNAIIGEDNSVTGGIIGAATLLIVNYGVVKFLYTHEKLDRLIEGDQCVLIENGVAECRSAETRADHPVGARNGRAQAGLRVARRDRPRRPRSGRRHQLLGEEAGAGHVAARRDHGAARRAVGADVRAPGVARMIDDARGTFRSTRSARPRRRCRHARRRRPHAARARGSAGTRRDAARPRALPQARSAAAHRLVQDPRRPQRRPPAHAAISWPAASGPSAPATRRWASRTPRGGPARAAR